jgi:N-methylhydantoinase A/acetophenone carboxylase
MGYTIDIDTGGTFTDGIIVHGPEARTVKVPTTPHDLTVCFGACIQACAEAFEQPVDALLAQTEIVRFCNTIGTNTIIQRDGAKIGLILTRGCERLAPTEAGNSPAPLVPPDLVAGLGEQMSAQGRSQSAPDATETLAVAQSLIDRGARALVIAFAHSERNPEHERLARQFIKREYPRDYLGSVPVFLASDISTRSGYVERINTAAINAYIHGKLARLLYKAGEDLRQIEYRGVLFIGHNDGAVARVAKTRAINTYNSGPTAGLLGAQAVGRLYGANVISTDMGGTSFDIGVVRDGRAGLTLEPDVEGFRCNLPMLSIHALGAGGGSLASVSDGILRVGPRSAGAVPGPACFDRGGTQPTVTDANVVLGLLDPEYFLGGAQRLDAARARDAIQRHIAAPLDISVEAAAFAIKSEVDRLMGEGVAEAAGGLDPRNTIMVAYGGAGPLHMCAVADRAGLDRVILTPFSAVFSAFSSSLMDVGHLYFRRLDVQLAAENDVAPLRMAEQSMRMEAHRDMRGEGFDLNSLEYELRLFIGCGSDGRELLLHAPSAVYEDRSTWRALIDQARQEIERQRSAADALVLTSLGLSARATTPHIDLARRHSDRAASPVARGTRSVHDGRTWNAVSIYDYSALGCGSRLAGPALIESKQTTVYVEPGWQLAVDVYRNAVISRGFS